MTKGLDDETGLGVRDGAARRGAGVRGGRGRRGCRRGRRGRQRAAAVAKTRRSTATSAGDD